MATRSITAEIPVKDKMAVEQLVKVSLMKEMIKPTKPHRHANYHELIVLSQGAGFHEVDTHDYEVVTPVIYYLRPGQTHCWNFTAIPKGYVILFREELLRKEDIDLLYTLPSQVTLEKHELLFELVAAFYSEFKAGEAGTEVYRAYLHLLITKFRHLSQTVRTGHSASDQLFQLYKREVNEHFTQNRQLLFYADKLNITTAVLNETCKKAVGKTAMTIINERVLLESKLLLSATASPVNAIAHQLKFSDAPHFINFFKLHTNLTPGHYRELALAKK
jgi:AraC-like DNA-binding protein